MDDDRVNFSYTLTYDDLIRIANNVGMSYEIIPYTGGCIVRIKSANTDFVFSTISPELVDIRVINGG